MEIKYNTTFFKISQIRDGSFVAPCICSLFYIRHLTVPTLKTVAYRVVLVKPHFGSEIAAYVYFTNYDN